MQNSKLFLSAQWKKLVMANYVVDPKLLTDFVPAQTQLDLWQGRCYVSLVGFMFLDTKVLGFKMPWHINFEEVNLRFYVTHFDHDSQELRRGVVFIKEIVPKSMITFFANTLYGEHYHTMPMQHFWQVENADQVIVYQWKKKHWHRIEVHADTVAQNLTKDSEAEFITEHYWGYTKLTSQKTSQYRVEHPAWQIYNVKDYSIQVDFGEVYGKNFSFLNDEKPISVFLAEGSPIQVRQDKTIR